MLIGANEINDQFPCAELAPPEDHARGLKLYDPAKVQDQQISSRETVKWVATNLCFQVDISEAPNRAGWSLLMWAREHQDRFWQMFKSTIEKDQDVRDPLKDDGGEVLNLLETLEREGFKVDTKENKT